MKIDPFAIDGEGKTLEDCFPTEFKRNWSCPDCTPSTTTDLVLLADNLKEAAYQLAMFSGQCGDMAKYALIFAGLRGAAASEDPNKLSEFERTLPFLVDLAREMQAAEDIYSAAKQKEAGAPIQ